MRKDFKPPTVEKTELDPQYGVMLLEDSGESRKREYVYNFLDESIVEQFKQWKGFKSYR